MSQVHKETQTTLEEAARRMKTQYDKRRCDAHIYQVRDKVWLDATNLHLPCPKKKLDDKRVSPFEILDKARAVAYKLKLPSHWKIHPRFNEKLLMPYVSPAFLNETLPLPPPPDLINSEEEFGIEEVLDSRTRTV